MIERTGVSGGLGRPILKIRVAAHALKTAVPPPLDRVFYFCLNIFIIAVLLGTPTLPALASEEVFEPLGMYRSMRGVVPDQIRDAYVCAALLGGMIQKQRNSPTSDARDVQYMPAVERMFLNATDRLYQAVPVKKAEPILQGILQKASSLTYEDRYAMGVRCGQLFAY
jgi:hypothetical protein